MKHGPPVSVVIPTLNAEKYLGHRYRGAELREFLVQAGFVVEGKTICARVFDLLYLLLYYTCGFHAVVSAIRSSRCAGAPAESGRQTKDGFLRFSSPTPTWPDQRYDESCAPPARLGRRTRAHLGSFGCRVVLDGVRGASGRGGRQSRLPRPRQKSTVQTIQTTASHDMRLTISPKRGSVHSGSPFQALGCLK